MNIVNNVIRKENIIPETISLPGRSTDIRLWIGDFNIKCSILSNNKLSEDLMDTNAQIEKLLPHRDPFLFVDEIVSTSQEEIIGMKTFSNRNAWLKGSFPGFNFVPGTILIESMAQCGGAGVKMLGTIEGLFGLARIEMAEFINGAEYDKPVRFVIKNLHLSKRLIKQSGTAFIGHTPVLKATWVCMRLE